MLNIFSKFLLLKIVSVVLKRPSSSNFQITTLLHIFLDILESLIQNYDQMVYIIDRNKLNKATRNAKEQSSKLRFSCHFHL